MVTNSGAWAEPWQFTPLCELDVRGVPVPQGSIRSLGAGRPSVHANAKRLKPWRELVQHAVEDVAAGLGVPLPLTGPIRLDLVFTMPKAKSAPKRRRTWATTRPDRGKLARGVEDAIQFAGLVRDDSQFVAGDTVKTFPLEHPDALEVPGVRIRLAFVGELESVPAPVVDDGIPW